MRLTSHSTYWSVVIEGISCAKKVRNFHKKPKNTQVTIAQEDFHITAILIKGFHPTEEAKDWAGPWGAWVP
eukprot:2387441-Alexandrium_andersonii.AAC.1